MPAHQNGRQAIASSPRHEMGQAVIPAYNRRQDLTLAYGLKPPPPAPEPEPRLAPTRVSSVLATLPQADSPPQPAEPARRPAPRHAYRPRPPASPPAPPVAPPEPTPAAPKQRSGRWVAVVAATALAGIAGAGVWAVDARAKSRTCDTVQTLFSASAEIGGPEPADLRLAESALTNRTRRLMFQAGLKDAARGLAADIASLRAGASSFDVTQMLAVVASINDHGRAAQQECGLPEKDLFAVTSG